MLEIHKNVTHLIFSRDGMGFPSLILESITLGVPPSPLNAINTNLINQTQIDALYPALQVLETNQVELRSSPGSVVQKAADAATKGALATKTMKAKAGRASYVAADKVQHLA